MNKFQAYEHILQERVKVSSMSGRDYDDLQKAY